MATLEKIRTRAGVFISVIIGIALLSFLVNPQDIMYYFQSSKNSVGEMGGHKISHQDYQKHLDYYSKMYELREGQPASGEQASEQVKAEAWEELLRQNVFEAQYKKVGIGISEAELKDLGTGQNLSPIMKRYFSNPQTGEVNWEGLQAFWKNTFTDDVNYQNRQQLIVYFENSIRNYDMMMKYYSLISKSDYINSLQAQHALEGSANSAEFSYITQRFMAGAEADSLYRIKTSEAKNFYTKNKKRYEQEEGRDIEFVNFPVLPSQEDDEQAKVALEKLMPSFAEATDLLQFVRLNSDDRSNNFAYHKQGELPTIFDEFAFSATKQDILPPTLDGGAYKMARINDVRMLPDSVRFRNIIVDAKTPEEAQGIVSKADSIRLALQNGASWEEMAMQYPADNQSMLKGGEVGWLTYEALGAQLGDSCFLNPTGKVMMLPLQDRAGYFIFQVSEKGKEVKKVQLAIVQKVISPSRKTYDAVYNRANQLASQAQGSYEAFNKAVQESGLVKQPASNLTRSAKTAGPLNNARELVRWAYNDDTKLHSISGVIALESQSFVVAALTAIREDGIAPFDQVKDQIGEELRKEKQAEDLAKKMKEAAAASAGNINTLAEKLNLQVMQMVDPITFSSIYIPGLGLEPKVVATATTLPTNTLSEPVAGTNGVYMLTVTDKRVDEGQTIEMAKSRISEMQMGQQMNFYTILLKTAKVKDLRGKFY